MGFEIPPGDKVAPDPWADPDEVGQEPAAQGFIAPDSDRIIALAPPPPPVVVTQIASPIVDWRDVMAAVGLACAIAWKFDLDIEAVWGRMTQISENHLLLLDTPQGWTLIAAWVAADLTGGLPSTSLLPTMH